MGDTYMMEVFFGFVKSKKVSGRELALCRSAGEEYIKKRGCSSSPLKLPYPVWRKAAPGLKKGIITPSLLDGGDDETRTRDLRRDRPAF
jgi:hypothetical protein